MADMYFIYGKVNGAAQLFHISKNPGIPLPSEYKN